MHATLKVENFGCLGKEGSDLTDRVAASIVGGTDGSSLARKGICKEGFFQIIFATTAVAISRQVHVYKLTLRDSQAVRGREQEAGGLRTTTWGWKVDEEYLVGWIIPVAKIKKCGQNKSANGEKRVIRDPRTNARMGRVDRNWTKTGGRLFSHGRGFC